jgi:hypothetical protein
MLVSQAVRFDPILTMSFGSTSNARIVVVDTYSWPDENSVTFPPE